MLLIWTSNSQEYIEMELSNRKKKNKLESTRILTTLLLLIIPYLIATTFIEPEEKIE